MLIMVCSALRDSRFIRNSIFGLNWTFVASVTDYIYLEDLVSLSGSIYVMMAAFT